MKLFILVLLALIFSVNVFSQDNIIISSKTDSAVGKWMRETNTPGLALAIIKNGRPLLTHYYGLANKETNSPVTEESEFMIASISKQFIATAILLLSQEGKLTLDSFAKYYIPELPATWSKLTIRELLSHTSGLVRDPEDYKPYVDQSLMGVLQSMYSLPLNSKPGERWLYSNAGYFLLAEIISRVSGESWDVFIKDRLFTPAGMTKSITNSSKDIIPNRVNGYHQDSKGMINAENWLAVRPSGAFFSTLDDMIKWDHFLDTSHILTVENKKLMWTPVKLSDRKPTEYGFGWGIDSILGRLRIHHNGQYPGFRSDYERFSDDSLHIIMLTNADNVEPDRFVLNLAGLYDFDLMPPAFFIALSKSEINTTPGKSVALKFQVWASKKDAPGSVVEMEIWNDQGKSIYKQDSQNQIFIADIKNEYSYSWIPEKPGVYTVNIGVYGPHWVIGYAWKMNLGQIIVK